MLAFEEALNGNTPSAAPPLQATHIFDGLESWPTHLVYVEGGRMVKGGPVESIPEMQVRWERHFIFWGGGRRCLNVAVGRGRVVRGTRGWELWRRRAAHLPAGWHAVQLAGCPVWITHYAYAPALHKRCSSLSSQPMHVHACAPCEPACDNNPTLCRRLPRCRRPRTGASCCMWWRLGCERRSASGGRRPPAEPQHSRQRSSGGGSRSCPASTWPSSASALRVVWSVMARCNTRSHVAGCVVRG